MNLFADDYKIDKPLRLIELFAGYGSQAMAFKRIGVPYEHHFVCEFDKYAMASYNAVHGTNFQPTDIRNIHASDLNITDTDKYCYFMTYSFPCTDLSLAGKGAGMKKGSGTRSGLLWEVERLLEECSELPQILFMENVPQVISEQNMPDFEEWLRYLENKGYSSFYKVLNAKDYGVPQNRERCFMFSFLGEWDYVFPTAKKLELRVKDILEQEVEEKYYINTERAKTLIDNLKTNNEEMYKIGNVHPSGNGINGNVYAGDVAPTLTTNKGEGQKMLVENIPCALSECDKENGFLKKEEHSLMDLNMESAHSICSRYYKGISGNGDNVVLENIIIGGMQKNQAVKTDGICTSLTSAMGEGGGMTPLLVKKINE